MTSSKRGHELVNITYWIENPEWNPGGSLQFWCNASRMLPFSVHSLAKAALLNPRAEILGVGGESITIAENELALKAMYRKPDSLDLRAFEANVRDETSCVIEKLGGVALATEIDIRRPDIFRSNRMNVDAVSQLQQRIYPSQNPPYTDQSPTTQTKRDIEQLVEGSDELMEIGYVPDIARASNNLRYDVQTGHLTLIDVMPAYTEGSRLIGDGVHLTGPTLRRLDELKQIIS